MNKTVTITLNGIIFHIEEDAYNKLKGYLDTVSDHFSLTGDSAEIISDMETSIADKFSEKITGVKKVITKKDVDDLIEVMGTVKDIAEDVSDNGPDSGQQKKEGEQKQEKQYQAEKKLYRNPDDVIIAGVCSGLAAYFNVDPVLIRLLFFVSIFFGGAGIIAYLVLWMIMPVAKTNTQKLEMQGAIVTLKKLEEVAKEKAAGLKEKASNGEITRLLSLPFRFIGEIFRAMGNLMRKVVPVLAFVIGVLIIVGAVVGIAFNSLVAALFILGLDSAFINIDLPIKEIAGKTQYYLGIGSGALISLIPLFFILMIGVVLVRRKSVFSAIFNSVLVGLWMVSIMIFGIIAVDVGPRLEKGIRENEIAKRVEKEFELHNFESVYISGKHRAKIIPGEEFAVLVNGREKDIERLDLRIEDGQLKIGTFSRSGLCLFCNYLGVDINIVMPEITKAVLSDSARMDMEGFINEELELVLSGSAKMKLVADIKTLSGKLSGVSMLEYTGSSSKAYMEMDFASNFITDEAEFDKLDIRMEGMSQAELRGRAKELDADIGDSAKMFGFGMPVDDARVRASDAGKAELSVNKSLDVVTDDNSQVYYRGEAEITENLRETSLIMKQDETKGHSGSVYRVELEGAIDNIKYKLNEQHDEFRTIKEN